MKSRGLQLIGNSLLFVYDSAEDEDSDPKLKIIDFPKTVMDSENIDTDTLIGINNIAHYLQLILDR